MLFTFKMRIPNKQKEELLEILDSINFSRESFNYSGEKNIHIIDFKYDTFQFKIIKYGLDNYKVEIIGISSTDPTIKLEMDHS